MSCFFESNIYSGKYSDINYQFCAAGYLYTYRLPCYHIWTPTDHRESVIKKAATAVQTATMAALKSVEDDNPDAKKPRSSNKPLPPMVMAVQGPLAHL